MTIPVAVLVPVKAFTEAKVRLAGVMSRAERAALARELAGRVIAAAAPLPVAVVCDDDQVRAWAVAAGAEVIWRPGRGLNGAVTDGVAALGRDGFARVIVAHGDLPLAHDLAWVAEFAGITLVPDRHEDGTNVACVPTAAGFRFAYGAGSFRRHAAEGRRLRLGVRVARHPGLGWDVDQPADLVHPALTELVAGLLEPHPVPCP